MTATGRDVSGERNTAKEVEQKIDWIEKTLIVTLDRHATLLRVTALFKQ